MWYDMIYYEVSGKSVNIWKCKKNEFILSFKIKELKNLNCKDKESED